MAATPSTTEIIEIVIGDELLTPRNYGTWKIYMKDYLSRQGLWGVVDGTDAYDVNQSGPWKTRDEKAIHAIRKYCGPDMLRVISQEADAKGAWNLLALSATASAFTEEMSITTGSASPAIDFKETSLGDNELLTWSNYGSWKIRMKNKLLSQNIWSFVDTPLFVPLPGQGDNFPIWKIANNMALKIIKTACGAELLPHIKYIDTFRDAWDQLAVAAAASFEERDRYKTMLADAKTAKENLKNFVEADKTRTPSNQKKWRVYMESKLKSKYLWDIVDGSDDIVDGNENRTARDSILWPYKNRKALKVIKKSCGQEMRFLGEVDDAKEAWDELAAADCLDGAYIRYMPLLQAIHNDELEGCKKQHQLNPEVISTKLREDGSTALHVAVELGRVNIIKWLVKSMNPKQLEIKTVKGNTAISVAAEGNNVELIEIMVDKNANLLQIKDGRGRIPLVTSAIHGDEDVLRYLYSVTTLGKLNYKEIGDTNVATLITAALRVDLFDVALELLRKFPKIATTKDEYEMTVFSVLAGKPSAFPSGNRFGFWHERIYRWVGNGEPGPVCGALIAIVPAIKRLHDKNVRHDQANKIVKIIRPLLSKLSSSQLIEAGAYEAIHLTTIHGIVEFFKVLMNHPNLIHFKDESQRDLFQIAVTYRQQSIFNLLSKTGLRNQSIGRLDNDKNNVLHCAGLWKPSRLDKVSGEALQMQRELQWFQVVEKVVTVRHQEMENSKGLKPRELFTEEHKVLVKEGSAWMKDTSQACMLVSTLIATVMFAAAFTVPGGNNQNTGLPMFQNSKVFAIFIISDAVSLFASCTSVLMFFSLLTSRYAEQDFLISLPRKLILGLSSLFISIATMMAAFGATLVLALQKTAPWAYIPVTVLASVPVILFGFLQFPLFVDIVRSTYGPGIFSNQKVKTK